MNDTGTFSSSAAELTLGSSESKVVKAFLYWSGIYPNETLLINNLERDNMVVLDRPECDGCEFYTDIKILPPNATEYIDIKYSNTGSSYMSLKSEVIFDGLANRPYSTTIAPEQTVDGLNAADQSYVCFADVTSLFENLQENEQSINGLWTVGNIRATTGTRGAGSGGGWSLAVIYEDPLSSVQKSITFFDGFAFIESGGAPTEFNITGFETIPFGPVNVDIATIALEGDFGLPNDSFDINDQTDAGARSKC